jgi:hypothetical protein
MKVQRKRGRITSADSSRITKGFPPERCPKCSEAIVGVRKCKCQMGGMPRGLVWTRGRTLLAYVNGCPGCGSTLHTRCNRKVIE